MDELVTNFGPLELTCNEQLFNEYCGLGDMTSGFIRTTRTLTMDLNEAFRLLVEKGVVPQFLPKSEVRPCPPTGSPSTAALTPRLKAAPEQRQRRSSAAGSASQHRDGNGDGARGAGR